MESIQSLASVYVLVLLVFTLGFLVNWYRNRAAMSPYKRLGLWAGFSYLIFELLTLALSGGAFVGIGGMCLVAAALGWGLLRVWGFVNNGIFFSNQLNLRSFPLIAPRLGTPVETPAVDSVAVPPAAGSTPILDRPIEAEVVPPYQIEPTATLVAPVEPEASALPPPVGRSRYWLITFGIGVGAVAYSAVLFLITRPGPGLMAQDVRLSDVQSLTPLTLVVILESAFVEELLFRLGIQNYLGAKLIRIRYGYGIAIVLTAAFWTLAHVGALTPEWVKLAQIFPLGLALGWLYRRQGVESAIMAHGLFNLVGALVLWPLYLR